MPYVEIYILLKIYDYDCSSRVRYIRHVCKDIEHAKHLVGRLSTLKGIYTDGGRTGGWLMHHHGIDGFIESIDGIYEETTRRVA